MVSLLGVLVSRISQFSKRTQSEPSIMQNISHIRNRYLKNLIEDLYTQSIFKFCFKLYNDDVPNYFFTYLKYIEDCCHHYNLQNNHIRTHVYFHSFLARGLLFETIHILQNSPALIISKTSTHSLKGFGKYTKQYFIHFYNIHCNISNYMLEVQVIMRQLINETISYCL